jgi:hypothetical protein
MNHLSDERPALRGRPGKICVTSPDEWPDYHGSMVDRKPAADVHRTLDEMVALL